MLNYFIILLNVWPLINKKVSFWEECVVIFGGENQKSLQNRIYFGGPQLAFAH